MASETKVVGKAFRCSDGLIRFVTGYSRRGYYSLLWKDTASESDVWYSGGIIKADQWQGGEEVEAPEGSMNVCGANGRVYEMHRLDFQQEAQTDDR